MISIGTHPFRWTLFGMLFFSSIVLFRIVVGLKDIYMENAEDSFFFFSIFCFVLNLYSIYAVYKYKKIGVYLFPISLFLEIIYYILFGGWLIDNVVGIFWYIGFGLLPIIPNWKLFKSMI
ncbi:MAG: hypothetical protein H6604_04140 [Flavobacteriales bacterium]|nr:hypothetical protein [Flavobacteriales bacterium]